MGFVDVRKQMINNQYMDNIHSYLDEMIPVVLERGYNKRDLPNVKPPKMKGTPSVGIFEVLMYVYDELMGFRGHLRVTAEDSADIVRFKYDIHARMRDFREKMCLREAQRQALRDDTRGTTR